MRTLFRLVVALTVLGTPGTWTPLDACIKCSGSTCVVDAWHGGNLCKTGLGNAECIAQGYCGETIPPPGTKPKKPILAVTQSLYSVDLPIGKGLPSVETTPDLDSVRAAIAKSAGVSEKAVHLRSANLTIGYEVSGNADEAVGIGEAGHLFSASQRPDGVAHLRSCYFDSSTGPMVLAGEADLEPGQVLITKTTIAGENMIVALQYANYTEDEFQALGEGIQEAFREEARDTGEYTGFALMAKIAPGSCGK